MTKLSITSHTPQQFLFSTPSIKGAQGDTIKPGLDVTIRIDTYKVNKEQLKKNLASIFDEVIEYFE